MGCKNEKVVPAICTVVCVSRGVCRVLVHQRWAGAGKPKLMNSTIPISI